MASVFGDAIRFSKMMLPQSLKPQTPFIIEHKESILKVFKLLQKILYHLFNFCYFFHDDYWVSLPRKNSLSMI